MLRKETCFETTLWAVNETELGYILDALERNHLKYSVKQDYMVVEAGADKFARADNRVVSQTDTFGKRWSIKVSASAAQCMEYAETAIMNLVASAKVKYEKEVERKEDLMDENKRLKEELEKLRKKNEKKEEKA